MELKKSEYLKEVLSDEYRSINKKEYKALQTWFEYGYNGHVTLEFNLTDMTAIVVKRPDEEIEADRRRYAKWLGEDPDDQSRKREAAPVDEASAAAAALAMSEFERAAPYGRFQNGNAKKPAGPVVPELEQPVPAPAVTASASAAV